MMAWVDGRITVDGWPLEEDERAESVERRAGDMLWLRYRLPGSAD